MPDGSTPLLLRQDSEAGIIRLTLNRPDSRNSLSFAMLGALHQALSEIAHGSLGQSGPRVVVLAAASPVGPPDRYRA